MKPDERIAQLEKQIAELKATVDKLQKQQIVIVGAFVGTNVPVTVNGIRRKIATTSP